MRRALFALLAAALLLTAAAILGRPETSRAPASVTLAADPLAARIARAQQHLRDLPGDWTGWAALGAGYLEQARVTADPALYPKAEQAARRSLTLRKDGNSDALVVLGALANARHDFAGARGQARAAIAVNKDDADAYGVLADALTQLGDATGATGAVQRMLDLRPGLAAYTRASYDLELRGRVPAAVALMERALSGAADPQDVAFCRTQLGDLAFSQGDLTSASASYAAALDATLDSVAALRGRARTLAAQGDLAGAIADYAAVTSRLPGPSYLLEYAELLRAAGRPAEADAQLALAEAAQRLFTGNGGSDGLASAALALAANRPADAVRAARAEWAKRQHPDVADSLAWALHQAGKDAEALPYARRAVARGARSAEYAYHLAMIHLGLGDSAAARREFARALDINPYFSLTGAPNARRALAAGAQS